MYEAYSIINDSAKDNVIEGASYIRVKGNKLFNNLPGLREQINGRAGNDWLFGRGGNDVLRGGSGNDVLDGGDGHDYLFGNENNDLFLASLGNDTLDGGAGFDSASLMSLRGENSSLKPWLLNVAGHSGDDFSILDNRTDYLTTQGVEISRESSSTLSVSTTVDIPGFREESTKRLVNIEQIFATKYDDTIAGSDIGETFWGLKGNDTIHGNKGSDNLYGGEGNDSLSGDDGSDYLYAGKGDDILEGGSGQDILSADVSINDDTNQLYKNLLTGGEDSDLFIINGNTKQTLNTPGGNIDGGQLYYDRMLINTTNIGVSIAQTVFKTALAANPLTSLGLLVFKDLIPISKTLFDAYVLGGSSGETEEPSKLEDNNSNIVTDFDPTEDQALLYLGDNATINTTQAITNWTSTDGNINVDGINVETAGGQSVAFLGGNAFSNATFGGDSVVAQSVFNQVWDTRLTVFNDNNTPTLQLGSGGENNTTTLTDDSGLFADLAGVSSQFVLVGAYGSKELYGSSTSAGDHIFGTKSYSDFLHGYGKDSGSRENDGADQLFGYGGNDYLVGGAGSDALYGGAGSDTASYDDAETAIRAYLTDSTGYITNASVKKVTAIDTNGNFTTKNNAIGDLYSVNAFGRDAALDTEGGVLLGGVEAGYRNSNSTVVNAIDSLYSIENIIGSDYDDKIVGNSQDNTLNGGAGNDTLNPGYDPESTDSVDGGLGDDLLQVDYSSKNNGAGINLGGWKGPNTIYDRGNGSSKLVNFENIERFDITGTKYNDFFHGRAGDDIFFGGKGNDVFKGGAGDDIFFGGEGSDRFVFNVNTGVDKVLDFSSAEGDQIRIDASVYGIGTHPIFLSMLRFTNDTISIKNQDIVSLENYDSFNVNDVVLY